MLKEPLEYFSKLHVILEKLMEKTEPEHPDYRNIKLANSFCKKGKKRIGSELKRERKREFILNELIDTEKSYIKKL